ncbi:MAG TPA: FAD-dependent oxidoreductase [Pseudonocardia sp.]|jgi:3-oxosteroid 1-dehydrogenase
MDGSRLTEENRPDVVVVGSGVGGLVTALRANHLGLRPLVVEKSAELGGTTAWSGGALWAPDSELMRAAGVADTAEQALRYLEAVVGDAGPSTSTERKKAYVDHAGPMLSFLIGLGVKFVYADGNSDYYPEAAGGSVRGRTHHADIFDTRELGDWEPWFRRQKGGISQQIVLRSLAEAPPMTIATRDIGAAAVAARVVGRTVAAKLTGRHLVGMGQALMARLLHAAKARHIEIWRGTSATGLTMRDGAVVGLELDRGGVRQPIEAKQGVVLAAGGYAHNRALRTEHRPASSAGWTAVIEEDTGDLLSAATAIGAASGLLDEAIWTPMSILPNGVAIPHLWERSLPGSVIVDSSGARFCNEATSYMAVGQQIFARHATVPAIPAWLVFDARHRRRYPLGAAPPGITPPSWLRSGYLKKAATLAELAARCGIDPAGLRAGLDRFNALAERGRDEDFGRGESHHDRVFSDPRVRPNPCLAPIAKAPFYALSIYPGDVGTVGGLITDQFARVLGRDGTEPIPGLYATGSSAAAMVGRVYPASGCGVGSAAVFGYIAAGDIARRFQGMANAGGGDHGN